ncbi:MAG: inositol monophosphatase family protein [Thermoleophilia bacterium]
MTAAPAADEALVREAVALAREAGDLTLRWFGRADLAVDRKGDGTPVTEADRAVEALVREQVAAAHPDDGVLGEEQAERVGTSGRRWIVDPIDGTKAFTRAVPLYSTLLAVEDQHGLAAGVIHLPALGQTVWAGRGRGAFIDGRPARVSARAGLAGGYLTASEYSHWPAEMLLAVHGSGLAMRTWGDGYGYALVATGRVDAMVDPVAEPYDLAPMPLILDEAGGRFTNLAGADGYAGGSGVATNGLLHEELLGLLSPAPGGSR